MAAPVPESANAKAASVSMIMESLPPHKWYKNKMNEAIVRRGRQRENENNQELEEQTQMQCNFL